MTPKSTVPVVFMLSLAFAGAQGQTAKVVPSASSSQDRFGWAVAIEGRTMVVGAPQDFQSGGAGAAHVFVRSAGNWLEQATLASPVPQAGDGFGNAVALEGNLVAVGAPADDTSAGTNAGSVHVFARDDAGTPTSLLDDTWSLDAVVTPNDARPFDLFGVSVDLDGDAMVVGAWGVSALGNLAGSAYVFRRSGGIWVQEAKLFASDAAAGDRFGVSVAIDNNWLVVGANGDSAFHGAAYVFERVGAAWIERGKLAPSGSAGAAQFGRRVAIEADTVAVGATEENSSAGAVYVFRRSAAVWALEAELGASDAATAHRFGSGIALNGQLLAVGAHQFRAGAGAAYVFERDGALWSERDRLVAADGALRDAFGFSVGIDGFQLAVGAPLADAGGVDSGATYVFDVLTLQDQFDSLIDQVQDLVDDGTLNGGQGISLLAKLDAALKKVAQGNTTAAIQQLQSFVQQVGAMTSAGLLSSEDAAALVAAAQAIIDRLQE